LQVLAEWATELPICLAKGSGELRVTYLQELLPVVFKIDGIK